MSVTPAGLVTPAAQGTATITATVGSIAASASITVPDATGGLILNTNTTDPLVAYGTETNGAIDSFYGNRDSNGLPMSLYSVSSLGPDGTLRTAEMDTQGRVVKATNSTGATYDIQWLSGTTGVITFQTASGTPYAASAYFDASSLGPLARRPIVVPDSRPQPRNSPGRTQLTLTAHLPA